MGQKIERDHQRFRKLVRGKVKSNLAKYISRGEMIGKKGKDLVSIPLPQIAAARGRWDTPVSPLEPATAEGLPTTDQRS